MFFGDIFPGKAIGTAVGFFVCILAHHAAHARVAVAMGDRTPRLHGRMSLSIKPHVDTLGTIILPIVWTVVALFTSPLDRAFPFVGWGKAQSVSPHLMKRGRAGVIITSLAGPATTLAIGIAAGLAWRATDPTLPSSSIVTQILGGLTFVAMMVTVWELLPMPGRDGGRILAEFLPPNGKLKMQELAQYEVLFVFGAFLILSGVLFGIANFACKPVLGADCRILLS